MRLRLLLTFGKLSLQTALIANSVLLSFSVTSEIFAASASPSATLGKAKQQAEAKGFVFEPSHDEIVAKAKREGKLRALIGWDAPKVSLYRRTLARNLRFGRRAAFFLGTESRPG